MIKFFQKENTQMFLNSDIFKDFTFTSPIKLTEDNDQT
jgi:hypothetical protein